MQAKWKDLPLGFSLQTQIESKIRASEGATCFLPVRVDLFVRLNSGSVLQLGQYHVLGMLAIHKHDK